MAFSEVDRRAVSAVATQFFVNGAIFASFVPRLPEIRDRLDVSVAVLGALMTTAGFMGLAGSAVASRLIERLGTRTTLLAGATLMVLMLPVIGFATAPIVLVIGLGMLSALDVLVDVSMNLQGSWLSARRHAPIMNRLHGLWSLGTVVGGLLAAQLTASGVSLQVHLCAVAVVLAGALVFVSRGLLRTDEAQTEEPVVDGGQSNAGRQKAGRTALVVLAVAGGLAIAIELVSSDWAAFRLRDDFGTSLGFAGLAFVAFTGGMTTGRLAGDSVLQRVGSARMTAGAVAIAAVGLTMAALVPNRYAVLIGYVLAGIGNSTFFPKLYDDAAQLPGRRAAGLAALTAGSRIASLSLPVVVGSLAATSLSVGSATGLIVIPSVIGFAALTVARPARDRSG